MAKKPKYKQTKALRKNLPKQLHKSKSKSPKSKNKKSKKNLPIMAKILENKRSVQARSTDERKNAKNTVPITRRNLERWHENPGRMDLQGIDTIKTPKPVKVTKKAQEKVRKKIKRAKKKTTGYKEGWREVKTKSYLEVPKKARGKEGFPAYSSDTGTSYVYNKKKKRDDER